MAIDDIDRFPPEPLVSGASTLVRNGLMQSDMDAQGFRIVNLDTSNLVLDELPSQSADPNTWFNSYDQGSHTFGFTRPAFTNLSGNLTLTQQRAITRLGTIVEGTWRGTQLLPSFVPRLNEIRFPIGTVNCADQRVTGVGDPIDDEDAVNLRLIHQMASGLHPKPAVRVATTQNVLPSGLGQAVDGVTLVDNDRVLVKNQSSGRLWQNGIYLAHPGAWTRAPDSDTVDELVTASCFVLEGDTHTNETWFQITPAPFFITQDIPDPDHTYPEFRLLSRATGTEAGPGLDKDGNTIFAVGTTDRITIGTGIDIASTYAGQGSITHVGTVDIGTWEGDILDPEFGGTGVNNIGKTITLAGNLSTTLGTGAPLGATLNFVLSGSTFLQLPITGTLATRAGNETLTNKHISADQVDSGVLLITNGGTSANNAMDALRNLLPDATGHAGESLHTDGGTSGPVLFYWA